MINDEEARLLSGERNVVRAAARILDMGPTAVLIKRGEYGVIQFAGDSVFAVPAFPLEEVTDPTGAGDCFAGGFMGELARSGDTSAAGLRRAIVYGSVMGSFVVEDFGPRRLLQLTRDDIDAPLPAVRQPDRHRRRVSGEWGGRRGGGTVSTRWTSRSSCRSTTRSRTSTPCTPSSRGAGRDRARPTS